MLQIKAKIDYGLTIMTELAGHPDEIVSLSGLAKKIQISSVYLIQIARSLSRAGLIKSKEGAGGGYILTRPADKISLLAIIEALDGDNPGRGAGEPKFHCHLQGAWGVVVDDIKKVLEKKNLSSLLRMTTKI
jgi:Rrf2 family cysteine metabolism transcriptional repressor